MVIIDENDTIKHISWLACDAWDAEVTRNDILDQLEAVLRLRLPFALTLERGWDDDLQMRADYDVIVLRVLAERD